MTQPSCFVIMPFSIKYYRIKGSKPEDPPFKIDFEAVYKTLIKPAIIKADMDPIKADEETVNGIIHKPMFERIILCDYVVTDMTGANANAFYELGVRHAVKPFTTVTIFNSNSDIPFDVGPARSMSYTCDAEGKISDLDKTIEKLAEQLIRAKTDKTTDSPIYQLVDGINFQNSVAHEKTDIFRKQVEYNEQLKKALETARNKKGDAAIKAIDDIVQQQLQPLVNQEGGVLIDVMLSYRSADTEGGYKKMVAFIESLPAHIQQTVMVQEQYGFGLNRLKRREDAVIVLNKVLDKHGPSSETYGILGRVYKDWFDEYSDTNSPQYNKFKAEGYLEQACETYRKGFEADWRDAYPGINAVTLSELRNDQETVRQLAPVVEYSVLRKMSLRKPDYYDYATLLELNIINNNAEKATYNLKRALACKVESFMPKTTANNLRLIAGYREKRGEDTSLIKEIINGLNS
jgi:MAP3K TRAFs-binding domain